MKVFGVNYDGRSRRIVASNTQKQAASLLNTTTGHLRNYGGETSYAIEVELAMREPGIVWSQRYQLDAEWVRVGHNV